MLTEVSCRERVNYYASHIFPKLLGMWSVRVLAYNNSRLPRTDLHKIWCRGVVTTSTQHNKTLLMQAYRNMLFYTGTNTSLVLAEYSNSWEMKQQNGFCVLVFIVSGLWGVTLAAVIWQKADHGGRDRIVHTFHNFFPVDLGCCYSGTVTPLW
jgi:hypothetical protein